MMMCVGGPNDVCVTSTCEINPRVWACPNDIVAAVMDTNHHCSEVDPNFLTDECVLKLCKSGRICKVVGHAWKVDVNDTENAVIRPRNTWYETCRICGAVKVTRLVEEIVP
jgi:hypothetical protein